MLLLQLPFIYCPGWRLRVANSLAIFCAVVHGAAWPVFAILFGDLIQAAGEEVNVRDKTNRIALNMFVVGLVVTCCGTVWSSILSHTAKLRAASLSVSLFIVILSKPMSWYDNQTGTISLFTENIPKFEKAVGPKLGLFLMNTSQACFGISLSFLYGWQMPLVVLGALPMIALSTVGLSRSIGRATAQSNAAYSLANEVCSESIFCIRTVHTFNAQTVQTDKYVSHLHNGLKTIRKISIKLGLNYAFSGSSVFFLFAVSFVFGGFLISNNIGEYNPGSVVTVLIAILVGAFGLGQTAISTQAFTEGFTAIDKIVSITGGVRGKTCTNEPVRGFTCELPNLPADLSVLNLINVSFRYGKSPVLDSITISVSPGESVAIVGPSGTGKSSIISLMLRYYDVQDGTIFVSGRPIQTIPVAVLRQRIGYVGQEPVLFATSVRANLVFGLDRDVHQDELEQVLLSVNAWNFVNRLPQGLDTLCGVTAGLSHLSGGQKQRLAIARALLRNPDILLLDEATSALDNESERTVLEAITAVRGQRPSLATVSVAHRLTTISGSDRIYVLVPSENGSRVAESGTHEELIALDGIYAQMLVHVSEKDDPIIEMDQAETPESDVVSNAIDKSHISVAGSVNLIAGRCALFRQLATIGEINPWLFSAGTVGAVFKGLALPIDAFIFSAVSGYLFLSTDLMQNVAIGSIAYVGLGVLTLVATFVDIASFAIIRESVMVRFRTRLFNHYMNNVDIEFYDDPLNPPQIVAQRVADWAGQASAVVSVLPRISIEVISAFIGGCIVSFLASPLLAGVVIATFPVVLVASGIAAASYMGVDEPEPSKVNKSNPNASAASTCAGESSTPAETSISIVSETVSNMRTVRALNGESFQLAKLTHCSNQSVARSRRPAFMSGLAFGVSMGTMFFAYALGYYVGGILVANGKITVTQMTQAILGPMLTSLSIGEALAFLPDIGQSFMSANLMLAQLNKNSPSIASQPTTSSIKSIMLEDVGFAYPQRPHAPILNGLNLSIKGGEKMALVGESGGGKSTIFSLLLRFYEPDTGRITINNGSFVFDKKWFRSRIGYVAQEPVLFNMSLRENILYGFDGDESQLALAAEQACVDWVHAPEDWDIGVGEKGSRLSGGQKQRVAIARALIRNPDVFLFDEATSALDSACEQKIQTTFNRLVSIERKSVVVIAHRLSTVVNADVIVVIQKGKVVETGSHSNLLRNANGRYAKLYYNGLV